MQNLVCKFETLMNRDRVEKSKQSSILDLLLKRIKNSSFRISWSFLSLYSIY